MTPDPIFEDELAADGTLASTAVVFLRNQRCPFRCVMCDLWRHASETRAPVGDIPRQLEAALGVLPPARQIKLYNAGSFFDPAAIPPEDDDAIAALVGPFEGVIVEAHPAFLAGAHGERCLRFRDRLNGRLEVAIGLEAADDDVLARMNKPMTLQSFGQAAAFLDANDIDLRVFVLVKPPFVADEEVIDLACRSVEFARASGATACSVIPTRAGNTGMPPDFVEPRLTSVERVMDHAIAGASDCKAGLAKQPRHLRVFADLWDVARFYDCAGSPSRAERLREMNRTQRIPAPVRCDHGC